VAAGALAQVSGRVRPYQSGVIVSVQREGAGRWITLASGAPARSGSFALTFAAPSRPGKLVERVLVSRGRADVAASRTRTVRIVKAKGALVSGVHAVVLDPSVVSATPAPGKPGTLMYAGGDDVQVGQIIAIGAGPTAPFGFLGKATAVSDENGSTAVSTVPVSLLQAVPQGSIDAVLSTGQAQASRARATTAAEKPFSCDGSGSATITADASFSALLDFKADWRVFGGLQSASLTANASAGGSLTAEAQAAVNCELKKSKVVQFDGPTATVWVGPVPVVLTSQIIVYVDADAGANAAITSSVGTGFSASAGIGWTKSGGFAPIHTFNSHLSFQPPVLTANAHVAGDLTPTVDVLLYGVAGPEIALKAGLDLEANTTANPWWTLTAPVDLTASLTVPDLNLSSPTLHVYQHTFTLATAGGPLGGTAPPPPPPSATVSVTNPGAQQGVLAGPVNLQIQASDTDDGALSFSAAGLPAGLSIDPGSGLVSGTPSSTGTSSVTVTATDASGASDSTTFDWSITSALTTFYSTDLTGGYVAAGVGMRNLGFGHISLSGIPSGSTIVAAFLMWDVLDNTQQPGDAQGMFNGTSLTGTPLGSGLSPCWPEATDNYAYEADVTSLVSGNASYSLTGFASGATDGSDPWNVGSPVPELEGASLVVVYDNAASPMTHIDISGGATMTSGQGLTSIGVTLGGFTVSAAPSVQTTFIVADGQSSADGPATFDGVALNPGDFQGLDPMDVPSYSQGDLWDTSTYDVSGDVTTGDTSATATIGTAQDCLVWVGQALSSS